MNVTQKWNGTITDLFVKSHRAETRTVKHTIKYWTIWLAQASRVVMIRTKDTDFALWLVDNIVGVLRTLARVYLQEMLKKWRWPCVPFVKVPLPLSVECWVCQKPLLSFTYLLSVTYQRFLRPYVWKLKNRGNRYKIKNMNFVFNIIVITILSISTLC